ncbi:MAG: hypothetical protein JOZ66_07215 [Hyphomicrobiales bacterium]|nr:hypothetical protein [Hyphomicrobiales bacterium]
MVTRNIGFLALLSMLLCDDVGLAARAESHRHQEPRTAIAWPDGCAYYPIDDAAPNAHGLERECAAALSSITDWPKSPEECDYDYGKDLFLGPARVPSPRFLPLSPGKFLIEMDCGGGAYNPLKAYLFYRETKSLTAGKLLRFPYYPFGSSSAPEHVPPLIWKTVISARAFNRRRGELNVFAKFRGLAIAALSPVMSFQVTSRYCGSFASRRRVTIVFPMRFAGTTLKVPRDGEK